MTLYFKGTRKILIGLGLASCGAAVFALLEFNNHKALTKGHYNDNYFKSFGHLNPEGPQKWDFNWDLRQPQNLNQRSRNSFQNSLQGNTYVKEEKKPRVSRHLLLIRHGQYNLEGSSDEEKILTELGRQQAQQAAQRLRQLNLPYKKIVQSTMKRAVETAQIISKSLPDVPVTSCELLREGIPVAPEPYLGTLCETKVFYDGPRIEAAFRRYFHRADASQESDSFEIIVCHANVIRYFLCRALQLDPEAWLRFSLHNCSLTWIELMSNGLVVVHVVGDIGFMPPNKLTVH